MSLERGHLHLLTALAADGRLGAAADRIGLSPSAASRRLREAERRVGTELAVAEGRSIRLTPAGRLLADAAQRILRDLETAELEARWLGGGPARRVRIGMGFHDELTRRLLPDPGEWELVRVPESDAASAVRAGSADVMLHAVATPTSGIRTVDDRLVAILPLDDTLSDAPVHPEDLADLVFFCSGRDPRPGFEFEQFFHPAGTAPERIVTIESEATIAGLVAAGHGCTIQPSLAATGLAANAALSVRDLAIDIDVAWRVDHDGSDAATAIADALLDRLEALASA